MSSDHVVSRVHDLLEEHGDMAAEEITKRLAEQGVALTVMSPESVESYERDGEEVMLVRGGSHWAISTDALEARMRRQMTGLRKNGDGTWTAVDDVNGAILRGDA